eukprot:NODE_260_length_12610_cov_0.413076.p5 type:complete len:224 gc:universal NODE_260_length_12610_cov_0.413076:12419-11748(-)
MVYCKPDTKDFINYIIGAMFRPDEIYNYFLHNGEIKDEWNLPSRSSMPTKQIETPQDVDIWIKSKGLGLLLTTLLSLTDLVTDTIIPNEVDSKIENLSSALDAIDNEIQNFTSDNKISSTRFGDPNVRKFHTWISENSGNLIYDIGPLSVEANSYFNESFGSFRLDFGSGHELNFLAFLCIHYKHNSSKEFGRQLILVVYGRYIKLVRKIIVSFNLEPAGIFH